MCSSILKSAVKVVLAATLVAGCIAKEEKPEPKADETSAAAVACAPVLPPAEPERAKLTLDPAATYTIVGAQSEKCLQPADVAVDGARLQIASCNGSKAQQFKMIPIPGEHYSIANVQSGKCFDVASASVDNGAAIQQFPCHGGLNQQWMFADGGSGTIRVAARNSGKVLDVAEEKTVDGTPVSQWDWKSSGNQPFRLKPAGAAAVAAKDVAGAGDKKSKAGKPAKTTTASAKP